VTTQQLYFFSGFYLVLSLIIAFLTRATVRRFVAALVAGFVLAIVVLGIITLCEKAGLWHMVITWTPYYLTLFVVGCAISAPTMYLITWRIARRWGWRGLAVTILVLLVVGPARDSAYLAIFPEWGSYAPGMMPLAAVGATYALGVVLGHVVMRVVAGPSQGSPLARRPWETA
jgi:hypothetical protein